MVDRRAEVAVRLLFGRRHAPRELLPTTGLKHLADLVATVVEVLDLLIEAPVVLCVGGLRIEERHEEECADENRPKRTHRSVPPVLLKRVFEIV